LVIHEDGERFTEVRAGDWTFVPAGARCELKAEGLSQGEKVELEVHPSSVQLRRGQRLVVWVSRAENPEAGAIPRREDKAGGDIGADGVKQPTERGKKSPEFKQERKVGGKAKGE
jgi:hypothetical protein